MLPMMIPKSATLEISEKRQSILEEDDDKFFVPTTSATAFELSRNGDETNRNDINVPPVVIQSPSSLSTRNPVGINIGGEFINVNRASSYVLGQTEENRIKFDLNPAKEGKKNEGAGKEDSESSSLADRTTATATDHIVKKFRQKFIILHYSPFKAVWDWVILLLVVYTAVFTPFTVAFLLNEDEKRAKLNQHASTRLFKKQQSGVDPFVIIDLIVDLMFLLDIFISFRTTFVSKEGEAIYDPMIIAKNYLRGWFVIDAFSAMPYDLLLFGSGNVDNIKITGLLKTFRLVRLIRIFPKLQKFSEYGLAMLLLLLAVFALVGHWLACVFYAIAYLERPTLPEPKYSWLDHLAEKYNMPFQENNSESGPDLKSKYITALFFTLTSLTSVGFGNVSPNTNYEKMFSICSMMLGSLISAAIFGNVTTIMMKMYQGTEELKEMQESVKDFIKFHSIPKQLERRMEESFEHTWSYTNGIDMNTVLKSFPESLQADICLHLNRQLLNTCPAFQDASDGCLRMLALRFNSTHVPPGDTLIHKGDNLTAIYFIARGTLEISHDDEVLAILDKNDIFGENIGKYQERDVMGRSSCDVRALSYCDLHKIERCDLLDVMETYPDFADSFEQKFHVTYDLRECELSEQKPTKKKASKISKSSTIKRASKGSSKSAAMTPPVAPRLSIAHLPLSLPAPPLQLAVDKPIFQIENVDNDDSIEQRYLRSSISSVKRLDTSMLESTNVSQSPSFLVQKQRSVTSYGSASNSSTVIGAANSGVINVNPARRVSGILRKKSRIIRSMARLMPAQVPTIAVSQSATMSPSMSAVAETAIIVGHVADTADSKTTLVSNQGDLRRHVSNLSEVESEIDHLAARIFKMEENLRSNMDELTSFIFNFIATESMPKTTTFEASANTNNNDSNENSNSNSIN